MQIYWIWNDMFQMHTSKKEQAVHLNFYIVFRGDHFCCLFLDA